MRWAGSSDSHGLRYVITQQRLREVLDYDPETGEFRWLVATGRRVNVGDLAGTDSYGRRFIRIDKRRYRAHRLAWLYVHGRWPANEIDHINGVADDNRIANLREATRSQNCENRRKPKRNSTSGFLGVWTHKATGKLRAQIVHNGKNYHLGLFNCPTAAYLLGYLPAKRRLHEFGTL